MICLWQRHQHFPVRHGWRLQLDKIWGRIVPHVPRMSREIPTENGGIKGDKQNFVLLLEVSNLSPHHN